MAARGLQAMEQAVKNISASKGGGGRSFNYFGLDDGESIILRFVTDTDDILTCDFYEFVKATINGKPTAQSFIVAPDYYADDPSWQGEDWVTKYGGQTEDYNTKQLVDPKPKERTVAIAVEREAVAIEGATGGRPKFRYQDKIIDIPVKGRDGAPDQTLKGRNFILIRKDAKTFWGNVVGYASEFGTLVDRDYKISRTGVKLATNFTCMPVGNGEDWEDVDVLRKEIKRRYGYDGTDEDGKEIARDSPNRLMYCPMTLDEWAEDQASEDRAKNLLASNPRADAQARREPPLNSPSQSAPPWAAPADEAQSGPAPAQGDLAGLRARLESHS